MATIGRRSAVAELPGGLQFEGTLGWLAWLGVHLVFLIGFRNRIVVMVNWAWNYLTWDRASRVSSTTAPTPTAKTMRPTHAQTNSSASRKAGLRAMAFCFHRSRLAAAAPWRPDRDGTVVRFAGASTGRAGHPNPNKARATRVTANV